MCLCEIQVLNSELLSRPMLLKSCRAFGEDPLPEALGRYIVALGLLE